MRLFLFLFRHGSTEGNTIKRYIGATDEPLCDFGIKEIEDERKALLDNTIESADKRAFIELNQSMRKIYVSPKTRTKQTAKILFPKSPLEEIADFREMSFGLFEGKNAAEMSTGEIGELYQQWVDSNCLSKCPDSAQFKGESKDSFSLRVCNALIELCQREKLKNGDVIPIVCHGGTIKALLERFAVKRMGYFDWQTNHGAYRFEEIEI